MKRFVARMKPFQLLTFGFVSYVIIGVLLLSLPWARILPVHFVDNVFNVVSAVSTTGLTTVSVADSYTFFGQFVLLCLFQLGGIGYMTMTSFIILSRGQFLSRTRVRILATEFALPQGFQITRFVYNMIFFTVIIEAVGVLILYFEFHAAGVKNALWSSIFHSVSAFTTAGFSLNNTSLEGFRDNRVVNAVISGLCYLGALGFIVLQDFYLACRYRDHRITFTSKVILGVTGAIFIIMTPLFYVIEPSIQGLAPADRLLVSCFQIMTASSTAGFNSVPIGQLSSASLTLIVIAMVIGASPSGTGGGVKTTSISVLSGILTSTLRGKKTVTFFGHAIPMVRLLTAVAATTLYIVVFQVGLFLLCLTETCDFIKIMFEVASALGTVGLSMGLTSDLSIWGRWIIIALMFIGRVGPLTIGLALFHSASTDESEAHKKSDLAV